MRLSRVLSVLFLALLLLLPAVALLATEDPGKPPIRGIWIITTDAIGARSESVFVAPAKEFQRWSGIKLSDDDASLEYLYCLAFPSGLPSGGYCFESCLGTVAPAVGTCCWVCPGACQHAYLAACPSDYGGGGTTGTCKGRICIQ